MGLIEISATAGSVAQVCVCFRVILAMSPCYAAGLDHWVQAFVVFLPALCLVGIDLHQQTLHVPNVISPIVLTRQLDWHGQWPCSLCCADMCPHDAKVTAHAGFSAHLYPDLFCTVSV